MYFHLAFLFFINSGQCAKILGVFMYPSISHQIIYQKIYTKLSLRGHQVTVVTPNPLNNSSLTNLTEISVHFVYEILSKSHVQTTFSKDINPYDVLKSAYKIIDKIVDLELNSSQFRNLISDQTQNFDLILIHFGHPVMYALAARYQAPVISISSTSVFGATYDSVGNPNHPVLYPDFFFSFAPAKLTILEKFQSFVYFVRHKYHYHWDFVPRAHKIAKKYFGNIPYIGDLEKNVTMLFVYRSVLMEPPKPNVPAVLDISFVNNEPPKPLPEDLQKILDGAREGVVYVSFGSNIKTTQFGRVLRSSILEALQDLPYKVLLKWDSDDYRVNSSNIIVKKWYPQKDLLAHPNVRVFVTQGGLQSIEEAIMGEVPLVGIPFIFDQPKNVRRLVELGIGEALNADTLNKSVFRNAVIKVATNISYQDKIRTVRKVSLDKSITGLESAVWWCEYVLRHKGAKHLRSLSVDMSHFQYFLFEVVAVFIIFLALTVWCFSKFWKLL